MLLALVPLLLVALIGAQAAHADTLTTTVPESVQENAPSIAEWVNRNTIGPTTPCDNVCTDLWLSEHRPMPNQPASRDMMADLEEFVGDDLVSAGDAGAPESLGLLDLAASAIPPVALGAADVAVWVKVGHELHDVLDNDDSSAELSASGMSNPKAVLKAPPLDLVDPPKYHFDTKLWVLYDGSSQFSYPQVISGQCPSYLGPFPQPGGWSYLPGPWASCGSDADGYRRGALIRRVGSAAHAPVDDTDPSVAGVTPAVTLPAPTPATGPAVMTALGNGVDDGRYQTLTPWLDSHLGGPSDDPTGQLVTIPAPNHQTYPQYLAQLQAEGLVGTVVALSDAAADPAYGPKTVIRTDPASGSKVQPGTAVNVYANPDDWPDPNATDDGGGTGTTGITPPVIPAIDTGPLNVSSGCSKFPFGVPCWVAGALGGWGGQGTCPSLDVPLTTTFTGGWHIDFCELQPAVDVVRPVILIGSILGLAWLFMGAAMGFGSGGGEAASGSSE